MTVWERLDDRPWFRLTSHFFSSLFDFGVLSEAASDSFRRVLIGIVAVLLTFGLLITRMYAIATTGPRNVEALRLAVIAAEALMIGLPMLVVAFATLLVSHSLFPDETDFRVLLVLPVSRPVVFLSKLLALALFAGLFIVSTHVAMLPLFLRLAAGRGVRDTFVQRLGAHLIASLGGSIFVVLALTAVNGLLLLSVPRARLQAASTAFRSLMLCALVLSVPLVIRLPAAGDLIAAQSLLLYLAPPLWFVGVQQVLLGHATPYFARLAQLGAVALGASLVIAIGTYSLLYRRFDRVMLRRADAGGSGRTAQRLFGISVAGRPFGAAISAFTHVTLARSPLHQGVFIAIAACGAGLVMNSFVGVKAIPRIQSYESALTSTSMWAPFALMFAMTLAVRAALVLPIEPRANWVFRMTEHDGSRVEQLNAVAGSFIRLGVIVPLAVIFPVEWAVFGRESLTAIAVAGMAGMFLVELQMSDWRRIPFTCSYMPGKRFVGLTLVIGFAAFMAFTSIGSGLFWHSLHHPIGALAVMALLGALVWERRRRRAWLARHEALLFEDTLPTEIEPLRLSLY